MRELSAVVFDDDDIFCCLFARILSKKGIKVTTYANPSQYFCSHPSVQSCPVEYPCVDFLLTDNKMPEMTGIEFLERLKNMGCKIPDQRIAMISGSLDEENQPKVKQLAGNIFDKLDSKSLIIEWIEESK
ncbi:MAG: response regulator [Desulfuromonadales bacterium]